MLTLRANISPPLTDDSTTDPPEVLVCEETSNNDLVTDIGLLHWCNTGSIEQVGICAERCKHVLPKDVDVVMRVVQDRLVQLDGFFGRASKSRTPMLAVAKTLYSGLEECKGTLQRVKNRHEAHQNGNGVTGLAPDSLRRKQEIERNLGGELG